MKGMPWFKMFGAEYLLDDKVAALPLECQGILVRLWCLQCQNSYIPKDPSITAALIGIDPRCFTRLWGHVSVFFVQGEVGGMEGVFYSERVREQLEAQTKKRPCRKESGRIGGIKSGEARRSKREANAKQKCEAKIEVEIEVETECNEIPNGISEGAATAPPPPAPEITEFFRQTPVTPKHETLKPKGTRTKAKADVQAEPSLVEMLGGRESPTSVAFWEFVDFWDKGAIHNHKTLAKTWLDHCARAAPDLDAGIKKINGPAKQYRANQEKLHETTKYMKNPLAWLQEEAYLEATEKPAKGGGAATMEDILGGAIYPYYKRVLGAWQPLAKPHITTAKAFLAASKRYNPEMIAASAEDYCNECRDDGRPMRPILEWLESQTPAEKRAV